jgi:drug/metabolite transporter (DMT)-like permease
MILAGLSFLVVNFFVKILGTKNSFFGNENTFPAHELVFFRSIVSFTITVFLLKLKKLPILGVNKKWLIIRGTSGMIALTMFFYTIQNLPLAISSTIQYLAPIFTVILAVLILKERLVKFQWVFIFISFSGAILIGFSDYFTSSNLIKINLFWVGIGIVSSFFSGIAYVSILKLKTTDSPLNVVLYFPMISIPIMGVWCFFDFVVPIGREWFFLLIIGVFTQIAQILLTKAFNEGDANSIAPFQYLGSIYALLIGFLVFDEMLDLISFLGISFILLGVLMNVLLKLKFSKKAREL